MKKEFVPYFELASSIDQPYVVRKSIIALAVGYAVACNLELPSAELANPQEHYASKFESAARGWVGYFNEVTVMDCPAACEAARNFWMIRYNAVHNCPSLDMIDGDFFKSMMGATSYFSPETIALLDKHNDVIAPIYRAACLVLKNWSGK